MFCVDHKLTKKKLYILICFNISVNDKRLHLNIGILAQRNVFFGTKWLLLN